MNFVAFSLLILLVVAMILYTVKNVKYQNVLLLFVNYLFYGFCDYRFLGLLIMTTAVIYYAGLSIRKRFAVFLGVGWPLLVLGIFKYYNFFVSSLSGLFPDLSTVTLKIVVPLGISFYSFLAISYILDVKNDKLVAEKDFVKLALYISFFPTVIAGPITKAKELLPQFAISRNVSWVNVKVGIQYIATGCMKKLVLADNMGVLVDEVYAAPLAFDTYTVWLAVVTYSLQLYFDFSGYSDIAMGISRCLGFEIAENFNMPYLARNMPEFWKRWHISLSTWLQEYLYIPLGGNRVDIVKSYRNLMVVMLLCGLWHGASWNFVFWGGGTRLSVVPTKDI